VPRPALTLLAPASQRRADVLMPDADGFELLELIQTGLHLSTPVVMMSTDSGDVRLRSLRSGAASFLSKPVRPDQLQSLWQVAPAAGGAQSPHRSNSLDALDEAGRAAGMASGQVLLKCRADELARSAPTGEGLDGVAAAAIAAASRPSTTSTRVERLLKEREMRRVRSMTGLDGDGAGSESLPSPTPHSTPQAHSTPLSSRDLSVDNLAALGDGPAPETRQRLIVVANRLPVSAKRRPDGGWSLEISAGGLVSALLGIQQALVIIAREFGVYGQP
jgi:CheY-like chemotaxis protein